MGLTHQLESFRKNTLNLNAWHKPWWNIHTGGTLIFTCVLLLISTIGTLKNYTNYLINKENLENAKNSLEEVKVLNLLNEQYKHALDNKSSAQISNQYNTFTKPTSFSEMKSYLKKWQTHLRIKTLNVTMGAAKAHNQGKGITLTPMRFTAHVLNDKMFYQLLAKLQNEAPGLIVLKHIDLKRITGSNPETIDQLLTGKKSTLIEGTIECDWFFIGTRE